MSKQEIAIRQDIFILDEGQVVVRWPAKLSQDSFDDFEALLNLVSRRAKRSIIAENETPNLAADFRF